MGWITDLFEGISLSSELIAKLNAIEAQFAVLESENVKLKIDLQDLREQVAKIEREKQEFERKRQDLVTTREFHDDLLNETTEGLLIMLARGGGTIPARTLASIKPGSRLANVTRMKELAKQGYIEITQHKGRNLKTQTVSLTEKGETYLDEHFLR